MASGSFSFSVGGSFQGRCSWSSSHNGGNNCIVRITVSARTTDGATHQITGSGSVFEQLGGFYDSFSMGSFALTSSWTNLYQTAFTVQYDAYGTAVANIASSLNIHYQTIDEWYAGSGSTGTKTIGSINKYATITSAPNFGDEDNPTITFSNAWNAKNLQAAISLDGSLDDIAYRSVSGGSYTFELTQEERNLLINSVSTGSSRSIKFLLKSTINSSTSKDAVEKLFSLTEFEPVINPVVVDMNNDTYELTGDYNKFIKGYSRAACQTHATARKNATITEYYFEHNGVVRKEKTDLASFIEVEVPLFIFGATDSRGNSTRQNYNVDIIEYFKPWCEIEVEYSRLADENMEAKFKIKGNGWNQNFGVKQNRFKLEWRITDANGYWSEWQDVSQSANFVFSKNEFVYSTTIYQLIYDKAYSFQARITDLVDSYTTPAVKKRLLPVFDWSEDDFNFNVPVVFQKGFTAAGGDYIVETGTTAMGTNGTWYWEKWNSGKAVCYGCRNYGTMAITTAWGNLYRSSTFTQTLPSGLFSTTPEVIDISFRGGSSAGGWIANHETTAPSASATGSFILVRPASATLSNSYLSFNVIGRWK